MLNGWKEIGAYIQRGTRTAQRWELSFGMPVHRPANKPRTSVIAFSEELRVWLLRNRAALARDVDPDMLSSMHLHEALDRLEAESREITAKLSSLRQHLRGRADTDAKPPS